MGIYDFVVQRIYQLCHEREITPNALSYLCGISQSTLKSILNGESKNPGVVTIKKICDGLDITLVEFFDTEEYKILEQEIKQVQFFTRLICMNKQKGACAVDFRACSFFNKAFLPLVVDDVFFDEFAEFLFVCGFCLVD